MGGAYETENAFVAFFTLFGSLRQIKKGHDPGHKTKSLANTDGSEHLNHLFIAIQFRRPCQEEQDRSENLDHPESAISGRFQAGRICGTSLASVLFLKISGQALCQITSPHRKCLQIAGIRKVTGWLGFGVLKIGDK